jgi:predicted small integral membrane protein
MYSNFTDYTTNYENISHILSMETTDDDGRYSYRAITSHIFHHRIYWFIITLELIYTLFFMIGTCYLYKNMNSSAEEFHEAKKPAIIGLFIALSLYYVGFQVIGVEWFNMDQSQAWSYKDWTRHIVDFILPLLIYIVIKVEH